MLTRVRRKLEMAVRVRDFIRAHPFTDPSQEAIAARFDDLLTRTDSLVVQEQTGRKNSATATRNRREARKEIEGALIRYLSRVADVAARENPGLAGRFKMPSRRAANAVFLADARDLVALARQHRELFGRHGLAAGLVDELDGALTGFQALTEVANAARREHVGARAVLNEVTAELMELVGVMDVVNKKRFTADPEPLAAWNSARNVLGPFHRKAGGNGSAPPSDGATDLAA